MVQLARHLNFFTESAKAVEAKIMVANERVADVEGEFCEAEAQVYVAEQAF